MEIHLQTDNDRGILSLSRGINYSKFRQNESNIVFESMHLVPLNLNNVILNSQNGF